jgi:hypothetical protein
MKYTILTCSLVAICGVALFSAPQDEARSGKSGKKSGKAKKVEVAHPFYWAAADPIRGDWQGTPGYVAQIVRMDDKTLSQQNLLPQAEDGGKYQANIFHQFDVPNDRPIVVLTGEASGSEIAFSGDGWSGAIADSHFKASKGQESFDLQHVKRTSPTLAAKPPAGAIVLFDGTNMNAWAKMKERDWLTEDGPSQWHLIGNGAMEVVPHAGSLISHQKFGDMKLHVEFRNIGGPTNSGVYLEDRYEANINEVFGRLDGNPCGGFDNSTSPDARPTIRCSRPVLEWQTFDIDFTAPRFDKAGNKTAGARVTMLFNGTKIYNDRELGPVTLNAARLGEAPTGPIQLQEHGMPVQFRNIWVVEKK